MSTGAQLNGLLLKSFKQSKSDSIQVNHLKFLEYCLISFFKVFVNFNVLIKFGKNKGGEGGNDFESVVIIF